MSNRLMAAIWRLIIPIPPMLWHKQVSGMRNLTPIIQGVLLGLEVTTG